MLEMVWNDLRGDSRYVQKWSFLLLIGKGSPIPLLPRRDVAAMVFVVLALVFFGGVWMIVSYWIGENRDGRQRQRGREITPVGSWKSRAIINVSVMYLEHTSEQFPAATKHVARIKLLKYSRTIHCDI